MKRIVTALLSALGLIATAQAQETAPATVIAELRARVLTLKLTDIGLRAADYATRPWGLLMETGLENGATYTLVVLADGSTSLYFSTGGGIIGAGEHELMRSAARSMLEVANRLQLEAQPVATTPPPSPGRVQFYLLTARGTLGYSADEEALGGGQDRASELFHAGHSVITEMQEIEQSKQRRR